MTAPVIIWLRRNLRLADNPALLDASEPGHPIMSAQRGIDTAIAMRAPWAGTRFLQLSEA